MSPLLREAAASHSPDSTTILELITSQPIRYSIMDDYTRAIHEKAPKRAIGLNNDTSTVQSMRYRVSPGNTRQQKYFDIAEDSHIDILGSDLESTTFSHDNAWLLYSPLPDDLPAAVNKDVLILMAAYHGNVDRYSRLRRPSLVTNEVECVVRGIYHSTEFALWWSTTSSPIDIIYSRGHIRPTYYDK